MANFVPQTADNSPEQCRRLAVAANAALHGDTANIGRLACAAGQNSVTVKDKRCRAGDCCSFKEEIFRYAQER